MFYSGTKYQFKLPRPDLASGGIIASSCMPRMQLLMRQRKLVKEHPHLAHRMVDPQLYLAKIPATSKSVPNLATYPWFGVANQPFHSSQHKVADWMATHGGQLKADWTGHVPVADTEILQLVASCIDFQLRMGVEAIILPSPLTDFIAGQYELETKYLNAAEEHCKHAAIQVPVFATIAFSDQAVRGTDPTNNSLLSTMTAQIASRSFIQGAYIIVEQSNDHGHVYSCEEGCLSLLILADDLARGARKRVVCNYAGLFGAISMAAGTSIWASGYYRSQRRFRIADQEDETGRAMPRLYSPGLLGDIGVEKDAQCIYGTSYRDHALYTTQDSAPLYAAFAVGKSANAVPEWAYTQGNIGASAAHYYQVCKIVDEFISAHDQTGRIKLIDKALERAAKMAEEMKTQNTLGKPNHTELSHQQVWFNAFRKWRGYSKL